MSAKNTYRIVAIAAVLTATSVLITPASAQHCGVKFGIRHHDVYDYGYVFDRHCSGFRYYDYYYPSPSQRYEYPSCRGRDCDTYSPATVRPYERYVPNFNGPDLSTPRPLPPEPAPSVRPPAASNSVPPAVDDAPSLPARPRGDDESIPDGLLKLSPADRATALAQRTCPVTGVALGEHGAPIKVRVQGRDVFVCCEGCVDQVKTNPDKFLAIVTRHK